MAIGCESFHVRLRSDGACKFSDDAKSVGKCSSESGVRMFDVRKKLANDLLDATHSKSLLSVPSICVDNGEAGFNFDASSVCDDDPSVSDAVSLVDAETVSMIVRNVEAAEKLEARRDSSDVEGELVEVPMPQTDDQVSPSGRKIATAKKHDFMHDLKGKFHHLSDGRKKHEMHKTESPPKEHGKRFHDLKENVSGKIHQIAEKMHHFHLPHLPPHHTEVPQGGLIGQAMQTILMEKFNIVEASTTAHPSNDSALKRKSSSSSLQSIKQKFNLFQRPRRSIEMQSETSSLKSISEVALTGPSEKGLDDASEVATNDETKSATDELSILELKIHEEPEPGTSNESLITVKSLDPERKAISKDDLRHSVENFDSHLSAHKPYSKTAAFADTNKRPLHESLLSLSRNELLSTSPGVKSHARTESIGCKFSASPSKGVSSSLGKDQMTTGIHRRSSDSDLSITPKGEPHPHRMMLSFKLLSFIQIF